MILAAADQSERDTYFLDNLTAEDFKMTNQSGTYDRRDQVDDCDEFDDVILCKCIASIIKNQLLDSYKFV